MVLKVGVSLYYQNFTFWFAVVLFCIAPEVLKDLAPGSQPPFLIYNGDVHSDTNKIEEFLEETLAPPQWVLLLK